MVLMVFQGRKESLEKMGKMEEWVQQENLVNQGNRVLEEQEAGEVQMANLDKMEIMANQGQWENLVRMEEMGLMANQEDQEL